MINTRIPLSPECTKQTFLQSAYAYYANAPSWRELKDLTAVRDGKDYSGTSGQRKIQFYVENDFVLITMTHNDMSNCIQHIIYKSDYHGTPVLGIQVERSGEGVAETDKTPIPQFTRNLMWNGHYGKDVLPIRENASLISLDNLDIVDYLLPENYFELPVVYVSVPNNGKHLFNYEKLAYDLAGTAHVLVEANPVAASKLEGKFGDKKPYNGAISIFAAGSTNPYKIIISNQSEDTICKQVRTQITKMASKTLVDPELDVSQLRLDLLMHRLHGNSELAEMFDLILSEKDQEILQLKNALEDSRKSGYRPEFSYTEQISDSAASIACTEAELYPGEFNDIILRELSKGVRAAEDDPNQMERRSFHVLKDMLLRNTVSEHPADFMEQVRRIIGKGGNANQIDWSAMKRLGFQIVSDNNHVIVEYKEDPRYRFTFAKTPSDFRSYENNLKTMERTLFG